ncbi:hypothetical protein LUZ61_002315 [Rhynchospora tenuis]|uniref:RING-type E3 ubiquitin transferase n=1 Tax=Rhynchospora tenuis TaxID=198213 RepID=A0AAD5ZIS2_9POAL|nr:hypothetical protein LUZ61_002315 [Rhynchospora tenuis]
MTEKANRKRPRNKRGEASNPPSTEEEIGSGGQTLNPPSTQKGTGGGGKGASNPETDNCGGDTFSSPTPRERREPSDELKVTLKDPDLLDCSVCLEPLCPPIYQCTTGHVECSSCWSKRQEMKCNICPFPVSSRCIAVEKIVESVHLPCTYASYGCSQSVPYWQRELHTNACAFGPSSCPIPGCNHKAFSGQWLDHFTQSHRFRQTYFVYGESRTIVFEQGDSYFILSGPDQDLLLLVNEPVLSMGNALSLYSIDLPHLGQNVLLYELLVGTDTGKETSLAQLKSRVFSIKEKNKVSFLLLPPGFSTSRQMEVRLVIKKDVM